MPSTRPKDKYAAQMIIMFAPDQAIRDNAGMIVRGLNELGWTENGMITYSVFRLAARPHRPVCEVSAAWIRAGERKTCCAKALPPPPGLWALNARGSFSCVP